jgi:MFS transporter, DHA3 family, macrolide efflux protein
LTYYNIFPLTFLFLITIVSAFFFTFFNPAVSAVTPNIVHHDDLVKANSITGMSIQISVVIGAAASGFLYEEIGIVGIYLLNGVSFVISGISELFIQIPQLQALGKAKSHFLKDFKEGIIYVKNDKPTLGLLILALLFNFISQPFLTIIIPKIIKFTMLLDASYLGIFQSVSAIASICGMITITTLCKKKINHYGVLIFTLILSSVIIICYSIPILPNIQAQLTIGNVFIIYCILGFIFMLFMAIISIPMNVILQKRTPDEFRGRFFALLSTGCLCAAPLGNLIFGTLSDYIMPAIVVFVLGILLLTVSISMIFSPNLKMLYKVEKL